MKLSPVIALVTAIFAQSHGSAQSALDYARQREAATEPAPISVIEVGFEGTLPATKASGWLPPEENPAKSSKLVGVASLDYTVGTDGRIATCSVAASSGVPQFDAKACKLFTKYARYKTGATSGPLFARYGYRPDQPISRAATFFAANASSNARSPGQISRTPDMTGDFGEANASLVLAITSTGRVASCGAVDRATSPFITEGCRAAMRLRFSPATNERGEPVTRVYYRSIKSTRSR